MGASCAKQLQAANVGRGVIDNSSRKYGVGKLQNHATNQSCSQLALSHPQRAAGLERLSCQGKEWEKLCVKMGRGAGKVGHESVKECV